MGRMKRAGALLLCAVFILALSVSSAYLVHEAGHHCSDGDCPVCRTIAMVTGLLRALGILILVLSGLSAPAVCLCFGHLPAGTPVPASGTLVSWKIRLND